MQVKGECSCDEALAVASRVAFDLHQ